MRISDWSSDVCSSDLGLAVLVFHLPQVGGADGDVGVGVVQALGSAVGDAVAFRHSRPGGREYLHQAARVGGRARAGVEDAFGADLGRDPRRVEQVFGGLAADGGFVVDREADFIPALLLRSEEHTSELQSLMRSSYAVFCLKKKKTQKHR